MNACTVCKYITNKERCPVCGNPTSDNWSGLLIITKPEESELANELNIDYDTFIADSVENAKKQVEGMLLDHWKEQIVYLEDCIDLLQNTE